MSNTWLSLLTSHRVMNFAATFFGATLMYVYSLGKTPKGSVPAMQKVFPNKSALFYDRLDFFISIVAGSIVATIVFRPDDALRALTAGVGWSSALNILASGPQIHPTQLGATDVPK